MKYDYLQTRLQEDKDSIGREMEIVANENDIEKLKARLFILKGLAINEMISNLQIAVIEKRINELQNPKCAKTSTLIEKQAMKEMENIDNGTVNYTPKTYMKITELCFDAKPGLKSFKDLSGYLVWDYSEGTIYIWYPTVSMNLYPNGQWFIPLKVNYQNNNHYNYCITCYGPVEHEIK